jgi:hypothetical protein
MASHNQHHDIKICDAGKILREIKVLYLWPSMINFISSIFLFMTSEGSAIKNIRELSAIYLTSHHQNYCIKICGLGIKNIREFKVLYTWTPTIKIIASRFATPEGSAIKLTYGGLKCYIHELPPSKSSHQDLLRWKARRCILYSTCKNKGAAHDMLLLSSDWSKEYLTIHIWHMFNSCPFVRLRQARKVHIFI